MTIAKIKAKISKLEKDKREDPNESYFYNQEIKRLKNQLGLLRVKKGVSDSGKAIQSAGKTYSKVVKGRNKTKKRFAKGKLKGIAKGRKVYDDLSKPSMWGY